MVLGAVYTLWTFNRVFFGNVRSVSLSSYKDLSRKELAMFALIIFMLFFMGLFPHVILDSMMIDCVNILEHSKSALL
jgi:NADH-quinone oxidoreductase subunit M